MLISVLLNSYNYAAYVGRTIQSVLDQTYADIECIVVDDGSTDGTAAVLDAFDGITVLIKPNGGQTSAIRAGLPLCRGEVVILLDSDDTLRPDACEAVAAAWRAGTTLVQYKLDMRNLAGEKIGQYPLKPLLTDGHLRHALRWGEFPASPTSGNAFALDFVKQVYATLEDRELSHGSDGLLIWSAPLYGQVRVIDRVLGDYLVHGANASTSANASARKIYAQLLVNIAQRTQLQRQIERRGHASRPFERLLSPYHWRDMAFLMRAYPGRYDFPGFTIARCCRAGIAKFAVFPGTPRAARLRNMLALAFLFAVPRATLRRKLPEAEAR